MEVESSNSFIKRHKPLCIIIMKSWNMAQKFLHWEILKDWRQINITTIFSYLKIRLILHSSMYYFSPKKSNCNYQGLQHYSSFPKGLSIVSSLKFNFTFCIAILSFRHGLRVYCCPHAFKSNHYYDYYGSTFFFFEMI